MLAAQSLEVSVADRLLVKDLSFALEPGQFACVLGANGAGKSLTLHTLAGLRAPAAGRVALGGRPLGAWPRRERARRLGLLTQVTEDPFPGTVFDAVLIGRHPHIGVWQLEGERDLEVAHAVLAECGLDGFAGRAIDTLSGGERRRVALAAVLAQDPAVLLLDEPHNHLDPHHQLDVLKLVRARADAGRAVLATLHDPALAARFADRALLLFGDGGWRYGPVAEALTAESLSALYRVAMREIVVEGRRLFLSD
jgi:iron complex transport system ATP-binding protein